MNTRMAAARVLALACSCVLTVPAWAKGSVLSGTFNGTELIARPLAESRCDQSLMSYRESAFEVSASGTYYVQDAYGALRDAGGLDVVALVYEGRFDDSEPAQNLLASTGEYAQTEVDLAAGTNYILVVQKACTPREGAWAVTFTGPGSVRSAHAVAVPDFMAGTFNDDDPTRQSTCTDAWGPYTTRYQETGPIQVSRDGTYYFSDANDYALCLSVYTAPFNPDDPEAHFVAAAGWGSGVVELQAGQDYYFVVDQSWYVSFEKPEAWEYFFVLAPPAPFRVNPGLTDSWHNPETPGQGFFLDVFEDLNQVFLGWFTFATDPAAGDGAGHRWLTASGPFAGTSAELAIEWTAGGRFDAADPAPRQHLNGTIELEFSDCTSGQVKYDWHFADSGAAPVSGVVPIQRVAGNSAVLCELLYRGPGMPGSL